MKVIRVKGNDPVSFKVKDGYTYYIAFSRYRVREGEELLMEGTQEECEDFIKAI